MNEIPSPVTSHVVVPHSTPDSDHPSLPAIIRQAGHNARFAFEEFFHAKIRNAHTRRAYRRSVLRFLEWCELRNRQLQQVSPARVSCDSSEAPAKASGVSETKIAAAAELKFRIVRNLNPSVQDGRVNNALVSTIAFP